MDNADSLIADIKEAVVDDTPWYLDRRPRLHPKRLLQRVLNVLEEEMDERMAAAQEEIEDLKGEVERLAEEVGRLNDRIIELEGYA